MGISQIDIRSAINNVIDPDLGKSLAELNAIDIINIEDNIDDAFIEIKLKLPQPVHYVKDKIISECSGLLKEIAEGRELRISVSGNPQGTSDRTILPTVKNIIAVASGKGGVGKSSISSNIAAALSLSGASVGILDGDVYGPSQPTMFGLKDAKLEAVQNADGETIAKPVTKYGIKVASMGFVMQQQEAAIVRGPMLAGYFSMLFEQLDWGDLDYLIFDLPPGTGDIQLTLTQKIPLTGAVIVTTPQEISVADVRRSISMFRKVNVDILGIVENMSYFSPPDMPDRKYYVFGEGGGKRIANESNVPLLAEVPLNMEMRDGNDNGMPFVLKNPDSVQGKILISLTSNIVARVRRINYENSGASAPEISI